MPKPKPTPSDVFQELRLFIPFHPDMDPPTKNIAANYEDAEKLALDALQMAPKERGTRYGFASIELLL